MRDQVFMVDVTIVIEGLGSLFKYGACSSRMVYNLCISRELLI
jgi:hypothetical protein